jgi:GTP-binding protein
MKFIDEVQLHIRSGHGGSGAVSFRREKFVPFGGPDGGDGGRGGHVIVRTEPSINTLIDLRYRQKQFAPNGRPGEGRQRTGSDADDCVIRVPVGTQIINEEGEVLHDLVTPNQEIVLAKGGRGGRGNSHFATPSRRVPDFAQPGEEGEELHITLSLKLLADVSLIGFPNAGKSTLIRTVSNAKPRVADFPFTTIKPHLGVVRVDDDRSYVMADMPGLIEGASEGVGLGLRFLKHIERTGVFIFLLTRDYGEGRSITEDFLTLRRELAQFDPELLQRPYLIAISQADRFDVQEVIADEQELLTEHLHANSQEIYPFSSFSKEGLQPLLNAISQLLIDSGRWSISSEAW